MKYKYLWLFFVFSAMPSMSYGLGCIAHNYVAKEAASLLAAPAPYLSQIIATNTNDYLVGSDFPDSGYMPGATYGEFTHGQNFVNAFIDYLHANYPEPSPKRDRLLSFLMGICTHIMSDTRSHWRYYEEVAMHDFASEYATDPRGAWGKAHQIMDPGSDFYVIVKKNIFNHPVNWWVPVSDLVAIYTSKNQNVSSTEIIQSNVIYYIAVGWDEDLVALPAYLYNAYVQVPWAMANLENADPFLGAFPDEIMESATYLVDTWNQFKSVKGVKSRSKITLPAGKSMRPWLSPCLEFVKRSIQNGWITINPIAERDGSITITGECVVKTERYDREKKHFMKQLDLRGHVAGLKPPSR